MKEEVIITSLGKMRAVKNIKIRRETKFFVVFVFIININ
jgi:hypothetical protein